MAETLDSIPHKIIGVGVIWNRGFASQKPLGNGGIVGISRGKTRT